MASGVVWMIEEHLGLSSKLSILRDPIKVYLLRGKSSVFFGGEGAGEGGHRRVGVQAVS